MHIANIDYETRSECDLELHGGWVYSEHPSTEALLLGVSIDGCDPYIFDVRSKEIPPCLAYAIHAGCEVHSWNVPFEYGIWNNVLHWPQPARWFDTAALALAAGFPAKLETCAQALKLPEQKDKEGTRLIHWFCMPITSGKLKGQFRQPEAFPEEWEAFKLYCQQDVRTERAIGAALPQLSDSERAFWEATFDMNRVGIRIDTPLVRALDRMTDTGTKIVGDRVEEASQHALTGQEVKDDHGKTLRFVQAQGVDIHSVAKARVKEALSTDLPAPARTILEARQILGKSSTSKLVKMTAMAGRDEHARFLIRANGAETGRDTSMGIQLQNLPRGEKMPAEELITAALAGDVDGFLALAYTKRGQEKIFDPLGAVATCLRGCLRADGRFFQCDWAGIEPRMLAWQSYDEEMLAAFREFDAGRGPDIYKVFAATYFGITIAEVTSHQRQFGKVGILACQYGAGPDTVRKQAKDQYGLDLTEEQCIRLVDTYRATHQHVVAYWHNLESAARMAILRPEMVYNVGRIAFRHDGTHLWMRFPSGRKRCFPYASMKEKMTPWGELRRQIHYFASVHGNWSEYSTYGGALCNASVQGGSACLLRYAVLNLKAAGYDIRLRVHDEILADVGPDADYEHFKSIFLQTPPWATGLPLAAGGWIGPRYRKD